MGKKLLESAGWKQNLAAASTNTSALEADIKNV